MKLINCMAIIVTFSFLVIARAAESKLTDAHIHFKRYAFGAEQPSFEVSRKLLSSMSKYVEQGLLISDSWQLDEKDGSLRRKLNSELSIIHTSDPRFFGLCGVNLSWEDYQSETIDCLARPGIAGVKLHLAYEDRRIRDSTVELQNVISLVNKKRGFVLVHLSANESSSDLISLAKEFPETKIILAHSATGLDLSDLALQIEDSGVSNIYIDTSLFWVGKTKQTQPESFWPNHQSVVEHWKKIGIDKILLGGDFPSGTTQSESLWIFKCPFLSKDEMDKIVRLNLIRLLTDFLGGSK